MRATGIRRADGAPFIRPRPIRTKLTPVGPPHDGGYLLPDDLDGIHACVSPGVSQEVGFDRTVAARGIDVYIADASVDGPPVTRERLHFVPEFLDVFDDDTHLRLDRLAASIPDEQTGDRILQRDIEGAEYRVLLDASDEVHRNFRIVVIEFHHLNHVFSKFSLPLIQANFRKLLRHHDVVHIIRTTCRRRCGTTACACRTSWSSRSGARTGSTRSTVSTCPSPTRWMPTTTRSCRHSP